MDSSSSEQRSHSQFSTLNEDNGAHYTDFVVSVSGIDHDFIFRLPPSTTNDGEPSATLASSANDNSIPPDGSISGHPNFSFLGELHGKLLQLSNMSLSDYITDRQRQSEQSIALRNGESASEISRNTEEREVLKLFSKFYSAVRPDISNEDYIKRLVPYLALPSYVYVVAFVFMERFFSCQTTTNLDMLRLTPDNTHRVLITACFLAAKILCPSLSHVNLAHFSKVGGTRSPDELQRLVAAFGRIIEQKFEVTKNEFKVMLETL